MGQIDPTTAEWVEAATGTTLLAAEELIGGMSSQVHRCRMADGSDLVVRHITDRGWLQREPDLIEREETALRILGGAGPPTPSHLASDPVRGRLLMTRLPGVVVSSSEGLRQRIGALAEAAASISGVALRPDHGLPPWRSWAHGALRPPPWGDVALWSAAIDTYRARPAQRAADMSLLHRDFHPLNILWTDREVSGVVDWVNACVGDRRAELGHCRWNLTVLVDVEAADDFLARYRQATDLQDYSAWWDLETLMGLLPGPPGVAGWHALGRTDLTGAEVRAATERFLRAALERLE